MPYGTFQRVLGETSLERKCLFLFGTSLFLWIVGSFWWYGRSTTNLLYENTRSNCRVLVENSLIKLHAQKVGDLDARVLLETNIPGFEQISRSWTFLGSEHESPSRPNLSQPDPWEVQELRRLRAAYEQRLAERYRPPPTTSAAKGNPDESPDPLPIYETYKTSAPISADRLALNLREYNYYQVVEWREQCTSCHAGIYGLILEGMTPEQKVAAMPFRVVKVSLPFANTQRAINRYYAIALAIAIVAIFLSVLTLYFIVRYIIVRPIQHLRQVSEQVEQGNYEARADIQTQDELQDLAQAFNKMLQHLVESRAQLQSSNQALDAKVDQLAQANMQLYEMNRLKGDFLANVSHELRTPLNSIIGFSEVLEKIEALNEKQKRYVSNIRKSGRVLLDMINDILDLAKMESGKMELRPAEFQIQPVLDAQTDFVRSLAEEKNIDIHVDCPPHLPPLFQDPNKVGQILTNLLSNAIKFTPDGGSVRIIARREPTDPAEEVSGSTPPCLILQVSDTGIGIAKEDQEAIFEKFRQSAPAKGDTLTREYSGTGLGLSIVRELCKLLKGDVSVESDLGRGSTFTVRIPWHLPPAPVSRAEAELVDPRDFSERSRLAARRELVSPGTGPPTSAPTN